MLINLRKAEKKKIEPGWVEIGSKNEMKRAEIKLFRTAILFGKLLMVLYVIKNRLGLSYRPTTI